MGFGKDGKGVIFWTQESAFTLGTLAANDVASLSVESAIAEDFRLISMDWHVVWDSVATGDQNIIFGIAAGGLSAAEIEEAVEANPVGAHDMPAIEQSMRPVWPLGIFNHNADGSGSVLSKSGRTTIRWTMQNGVGWSWWVYNPTATLTTGSSLIILAKNFGVWVT